MCVYVKESQRKCVYVCVGACKGVVLCVRGKTKIADLGTSACLFSPRILLHHKEVKRFVKRYLIEKPSVVGLN